MLGLLMCNPRNLISTERFLEKIWGYDNEAEINVVWVYISYLRKKVDGIEVDDGEGGKRKVTPLIETKRGIGYMIREPKN